ncbi:MAG: phosphoglycerate kinase [Candidatus Puniceispirillales bacterium WSBS_2018_MAG_OTU23]
MSSYQKSKGGAISLSRLAECHIDKAEVAGKTVFFRCDLNVPMIDGVVTDTTRIDRVAAGIKTLATRGARVVVAAHYGRPKGVWAKDMSLQMIAPSLASAIGIGVTFIKDCIGSARNTAIAAMQDGDVMLLENLRFHAGEEQGDAGFAANLAVGIDIFVNDAFSASHRGHASIAVIAGILPSFAGSLMAAELTALAAALDQPKPPIAAVVGGAKVSTKLAVLDNLVKRVDTLIIGGGMANTFLYAQGIGIGASLAEVDMAEQARVIMNTANEVGCNIILPVDVVLAKEFKAEADCRIIRINGGGAIADDEMILDAGPETVAKAVHALNDANTLVWNGPMGAFEMKPFDAATNDLARHAAILTQMNGLISVAGGGDTVSALISAGIYSKFHYVSTAGGAFLEWMEGKTLPGVAALMPE